MKIKQCNPIETYILTKNRSFLSTYVVHIIKFQWKKLILPLDWAKKESGALISNCERSLWVKMNVKHWKLFCYLELGHFYKLCGIYKLFLLEKVYLPQFDDIIIITWPRAGRDVALPMCTLEIIWKTLFTVTEVLAIEF